MSKVLDLLLGREDWTTFIYKCDKYVDSVGSVDILCSVSPYRVLARLVLVPW